MIWKIFNIIKWRKNLIRHKFRTKKSPQEGQGKTKKEEIINADAAKDIFPIRPSTHTSKPNIMDNSQKAHKKQEIHKWPKEINPNLKIKPSNSSSASSQISSQKLSTNSDQSGQAPSWSVPESKKKQCPNRYTNNSYNLPSNINNSSFMSTPPLTSHCWSSSSTWVSISMTKSMSKSWFLLDWLKTVSKIMQKNCIK